VTTERPYGGCSIVIRACTVVSRAVIEGGMGRVFADAQEEPCVALAVLDFHFLAGDPLYPNALLLLGPVNDGFRTISAHQFDA
jgi:hypothetical protein